MKLLCNIGGILKMYLTRKDLLDYIETRNQLDDLAANASAFAQAFTSHWNNVMNIISEYCITWHNQVWKSAIESKEKEEEERTTK